MSLSYIKSSQSPVVEKSWLVWREGPGREVFMSVRKFCTVWGVWWGVWWVSGWVGPSIQAAAQAASPACLPACLPASQL
eukprot:12879971-Prorocentrum_lima.AAC.1